MKKNRRFVSKKLIPSVLAVSLLASIGVYAVTESSEGSGSRPGVHKKDVKNSLEVSKIAGYDTGFMDEDGGVAEIVKFNEDNKKFYLINGKAQTIDIVDTSKMTGDDPQELENEKSINIAEALNSDTFEYGDLTSIDVNTEKQVVVAAVQDKDYTKPGKIVVLNYDGEIQQTFDAGVQPDMVKVSEDGKYILTADEGEPRQGLENGIDPEGSVTIVNVETGETTRTLFDDPAVIGDEVHIRNQAGKDNAVRDLEPEYIALSDDAGKAYVSLQENNAIATIDVASGKILSVKSLEFKDHSQKGNELDAAVDGEINITPLPILGVYMPDSIEHVTIKGESYLLTANEGDATEWEEFENVTDFAKQKEEITLDGSLYKMPSKKAQQQFEEMKNTPAYDKLEVLTDRGTDAIYTLGGRSFSIWKADTMELVYDSGSDFEKITAERLPTVFNCSNDDNKFEKRSAKKGPEPEEVKTGQIGDKHYAFIGLERIGGIMTYDISNPKKPKFVNYDNTRDFTKKVAGDVSPEGMDFVSGDASHTGLPLVLTGNEVSGTVSVHQVTREEERKEIDNKDKKKE
ncbi:Ig domain-containing protein [Jeotgalibacillus sp. S-D1]|uniref:choice-of-anchor I family protein n=1 Tax=Jeotgalibacillus sp. S-D1 TaxID=2552189 RepID=UPI0010595BF1|nr:choice-of-anchor I family protein [Jeotgalibacillus sp. S-D1]TDL32017.1 Ig domain-containing protein [Jeotgalibacillus sp. S-D1]